MPRSTGNLGLAIAFVVLAVVFIAAAVYYWTTQTSFLASDFSIHHKHALLAAGLAVVCLIGANITRPKSA